MQSLRTVLLVLAVLCTPVSSLCLRAYDSDSGFLCDGELLSSADAERVVNAPYDGQETPEESRERRTLPGSSYKFLSHTLLRSKLYGSGARSDRRSRVTLSLDVPTNLMNALFDIARAKNLRAKAAHNARLMAQIGKRR
ncbi:urocortin 3, like [Neoarius graeffei]|uniref:urocortin 3, like n=1 Tax=Neoarius graeffei TaxID=443677 RepID=UPI00298D2957|nr:urocortin 3, like [Neoarius graeffei]